MPASRKKLRQFSVLALKERGFQVEPVRRADGAPSGTRLLARKGAKRLNVAVRSSVNRRITLTYRPDTPWSSISKADEVVVVTPAADDPTTIEVFGFAPALLIDVFDAEVAAQKRRGAELSEETPIFVRLDEKRRQLSFKRGPPLKARAEWQLRLPWNAIGADGESLLGDSGIDRVTKEVAGVILARLSRALADPLKPEQHGPRSVMSTPSPETRMLGWDRHMTEGEHQLMDRYLNRILDGHKSGIIDRLSARANLAHAIATMQNEGPRSVIEYFKADLELQDD